VPLSALTPAKLAGLYKTLESTGRKDYREGEGLSARTTRYVHTILGAALSAAVAAGLIARNPAADPKQSKPPTSKQARPPEMHPWDAEQLTVFLRWARDNSPLYTAWALLESTGMRRGELLALRWRDVDLDAATIAVRRSVGVVRNAGEGAQIEEGPTKTARPRVVDIASGDVALLRAWKRQRGSLALALAQGDSLVFGDIEGRHLHPERFSRTFTTTLKRCRKDLGEAAPPMIRLHDLRHTMATLWLQAGENIKVVSERLGHASVTITLTVYAHALPSMQRESADRRAVSI
jgi:integrase